MKKYAMITVIVLIVVLAFGFEGLLYRNMTRRPEEVEQKIWDFSGKIWIWVEFHDYDLYWVNTKINEYVKDYIDNPILFIVKKENEFERFAEDDVIDIYGALYLGNEFESEYSEKITLPLFTITEDTTGTYRKIN